ncbi:MAG: dihydrolipoyl dehydrogenase [Myxococcota bacterium]|nr:dihydrolipoyl dehydrogenase [Myxococcota bacterium]
MKNYDLIIIGAGPGGYVAAIRGAHLGLKTAIVEKDEKLGGTCLLRGCIPTKSLLHSADVMEETKNALKNGLIKGSFEFNFAAVQKSRRQIVSKSAAGVSYLMKKNKIDVFHGIGSLKSSNIVSVKGLEGTEELQSENIVLATGSVPRQVPFLKIDGKNFLTSDEVLELKIPPESMIILGAGAVGMEFASVYHRFGTKCTVVEMMDRVLPIEDEEVSAEMAKCYKKRGIEVITGAKLTSATVKNEMVVAEVEMGQGKKTLEASIILVAVGRAPVTKSIGLDAAGVEIDDGGFVKVDGLMQTNVPGIYAIGDIVRTPQLAHTASAEAILAVDHIKGKAVKPIDYLKNPNCTYTEPEVASVGLTENAAKKMGYNLRVGKFPFSAIGKARIMGHTEGFVKIVSDAKYDEILGIHIIGPRATDLISEATVALQLECTTEELAHTIHAHPTLPEALLEAAHAAMGSPIHM